MNRIFIFILAVFIIASCGKEKTIEFNIPETDLQEIKALQTTESKSAYLKSLWQKDQELRQGQVYEIAKKYGFDSKEYKDYVKDNKRSDYLVFKKLRAYLLIHGYPTNTEEYDELALNAITTIIGHNHRYEEQAELLPILFESYKKGHCDLAGVVGVMGEMFESKHGGRLYKMRSNVFTVDQEFAALRDTLGLTHMKLSN